jgi:hypothetical protein
MDKSRVRNKLSLPDWLLKFRLLRKKERKGGLAQLSLLAANFANF